MARYFAAALLLVTAVPSANAQRLRGRLVDLVSDEPVPAGAVTLLTPAGAAIVTAISDREGHWVIDIPGPGSYYVQATRIGYQRWVSGPVVVKPGDDWSSVFRLRRLPVLLDPVVVSAQVTRQYLHQAGFYERQRSNFGHFMSPEDLQKRHATTVTDLLTGLPGITVGLVGPGSVGGRAIQLRGSDLSRGGLCRPRVFVDGLMYARGDSRPRRRNNAVDAEQVVEDEIQRVDQAITLDDIGHPSTIAAIEVYRSATQVPVQFGGTSVETLCGVIVIWTRTGGVAADRR